MALLTFLFTWPVQIIYKLVIHVLVLSYQEWDLCLLNFHFIFGSGHTCSASQPIRLLLHLFQTANQQKDSAMVWYLTSPQSQLLCQVGFASSAWLFSILILWTSWFWTVEFLTLIHVSCPPQPDCLRPLNPVHLIWPAIVPGFLLVSALVTWPSPVTRFSLLFCVPWPTYTLNTILQWLLSATLIVCMSYCLQTTLKQTRRCRLSCGEG